MFPVPAQVSKEWSAAEVKDLEKFVLHNILTINSKMENFRNSKLPEYVRLYKGVPKSEEANFPWPGAANLVIQLIGTFCDEMLARIMGAVYLYDPLWVVHLCGDNPGQTGNDQKTLLQNFLM